MNLTENIANFALGRIVLRYDFRGGLRGGPGVGIRPDQQVVPRRYGQPGIVRARQDIRR